MNDPRGSIWRKWDLHFHTPSSPCYEDKTVTNEAIIDCLKRHKIGAVAITDHNIIDKERIRRLKIIAGNEITIFPGIELISELGGRHPVHFIGIFPEDIDLDDISVKIQGRLGLTPKDIEAKGKNAAYVDLKDSAKVIHQLGGIVTIHAGTKSNTLEEIENTKAYKMRLKRDLVADSVNFLEIGRKEDVEDYENIVFPNIGKELPLIIASDNHNIGKYEVKEKCWIKADTTFKGLLQIINEPTDRIFIGEIPEVLANVNENSTKFLNTLRVKKTKDNHFEEKWFDSELVFNYGLVAIIGNKGSGKSAIGDILGLLGGSTHEADFSFLNASKFRKQPENKASYFEAKLVWASDEGIKKNLADPVISDEIERVKYMPQQFLDKICNELATEDETQFDKELKEAIFSHVSDSDKLGRDSLDDLIGYKTGLIEKDIERLIMRINNINQRISTSEEKSTPEYKSRLSNKVKGKESELEALQKNRPEEVKKPESKPEDEGADELNKITEKTDGLAAKIDGIKTDLETIALKISNADRVITLLKQFEEQFDELKRECFPLLKDLGLDFDAIAKLDVDYKSLTVIKDDLLRDRENKNSEIDPKIPKSLAFLLKEEKEKKKAILRKATETSKRFEEYKTMLANWEKKKASIIGNEAKKDSLLFLEKELEDLKKLPAEITRLKEERNELSLRIYSDKTKIVSIYRELYEPVQRFIEDHPLIAKSIDIRFDTALINVGFSDRFLGFINQRRAGTFCGKEEGGRALSDLLTRYDFNRPDSIITFLTEILEYLTFDVRVNKEARIKKDIKEQLKTHYKTRDLYDYLFSLEYLQPRYSIKLGDSNLNLLSPGERGAVLLIFYLLIDKSDLPLIIDQPEDNLDNQTVFDLLVPCIKEGKKRRQIFLITHNPNLAVVCDAEQIIRAYLDKNDSNKVTYVCGAIENPNLNLSLSDVLEGTLKAFDNRDSKYQRDES